MTDTPAPTSRPARIRRTRRLPAAAGAVMVLCAAALTGCGQGEDGAADPAAAATTGSSATTSPSATPTGSPSSSPTATSGDPTPSPVIDKAVRAAIRDGFPALVPAGVPQGWSALSAAYDRAAGSWRIEMAAPGGDTVRLDQGPGSLEDLVATDLGADAAQTGSVDLAGSGTGTWQVHTNAEGIALAATIAGTSAVLTGPDQDTLVVLAQELLTAEDAPDTEG